jgi:hypothetical protein
VYSSCSPFHTSRESISRVSHNDTLMINIMSG